MTPFNWRTQPAQTRLQAPYTPKPWNGLADPVNQRRKGGISLPIDPQACTDKTAKITGKTPGHLRAKA